MPRVSVIIPTFNGAEFLGRALRSAFAQTYTDYEVVIADDGSTDDTRELLRPWEPKIVYAYQPHRGVSSARNLAISKATGEYLAYLDSDDMWYPDKLERNVAFLDQHPEYGLVHSDVTIVDGNGGVIFNSFNRDTKRQVPQGSCVMDLFERCHIQVPSVLERRTCYDLTDGFDGRVSPVEDYLHWIQIALDGQAIGYIDEPLAFYRRRTGSLSANQVNMEKALIRMFRILLEETALPNDLAPASQLVLRRRLAEKERALPYLFRCQGRNDLARRQAMSLIAAFPMELNPYLELMKASIPTTLARVLSRVRAGSGLLMRLAWKSMVKTSAEIRSPRLTTLHRHRPWRHP